MLHVWKLLLVRNRVEWMKGICHVRSRGRHFSPSLPGDRYLKLSSQKRSPSRNLGEHRLVRRSGTVSRGTALFALFWRMHRGPRTVVLTIFLGKNNSVGRAKCNAVNSIDPCQFTSSRAYIISLKLGTGSKTVHCSLKSCFVESFFFF